MIDIVGFATDQQKNCRPNHPTTSLTVASYIRFVDRLGAASAAHATPALITLHGSSPSPKAKGRLDI